MRYVITVTRYEQEIINGTYRGIDRVSSVEVTECADRAELLRELEAHGATAAERRADSFVYTLGRYRREWSAVVEPTDVSEQFPTINDDASLVILAHAGHEGALIELDVAKSRDLIRWASVLDELVRRGLIEAEDGEYFPTQLAVDAAVEHETERLRALALARR